MLLVVGTVHLRERAFKALLQSGEPVAAIDFMGSFWGRIPDLLIFDEPSSPGRSEAICEHARRLHERHGLSGVLTFDEPCVPVVAQVTEQLGLPGISVGVAKEARNKRQMRLRFSEAGLAQPRCASLSRLEDLKRFAEIVGYPLIVKPSEGYSSAGVVLAADPDGLLGAFEHARRFSNHDEDPLLLAEEYVEGPEVSAEVVAYGSRHHVVAVTDKVSTNGPYFVELGHVVPSRLPAETLCTVHETARRAIAALGITSGGAHVEMKLTSQSPVVIEVGARLAGDMIPDLVELATGADLYGAIVDCAMGRDPVGRLRETHRRWAGIRFLTSQPGLIVHAPDLEELGALPGKLSEAEMEGLVDLEVYVQEGVRVPPISGNEMRLGHVVVAADTLPQLMRKLEAWEARAAIEVRTSQ